MNVDKSPLPLDKGFNSTKKSFRIPNNFSSEERKSLYKRYLFLNEFSLERDKQKYKNTLHTVCFQMQLQHVSWSLQN